MTIFNEADYRNRVLGCWLGKNIGGTVGAPFEWKRQVNDISFYTHKLDGNPLPNDDLDLQLLWLIALEERGIDINARVLADYWQLYITPYWAEYGIAKINMRQGLMPPLSGSHENPYKDSCGAYIRSEIWACIAPGMPELAARYAYEDAIVDHGHGEGTYAELFFAALEAAAFVESDLQTLIAIGLSYIPENCGIARVILDVLAWHKEGRTWQEARDLVLKHHRGRYSLFGGISAEDRAKGFADGPVGYDAPSTIGITVLGLLYGEGDFAKTMTITVNCGEDTDCTAATAGSILGIIQGADAIPEEWIKPIGRAIKTACLNLGELGGFGSQLPQDVDDLTERTLRIAKQVLLAKNNGIAIDAHRETDTSDLPTGKLYAKDQGRSVYDRPEGPVYSFGTLDVTVDYGDAPTIRSGEPKTIRLLLRNSSKAVEMWNVHVFGPAGAQILPSAQAKVMTHTVTPEVRVLQLQLIVDRAAQTNRFIVEITADGRQTAQHVPIVLLNGDVASERVLLPVE